MSTYIQYEDCIEWIELRILTNIKNSYKVIVITKRYLNLYELSKFNKFEITLLSFDHIVHTSSTSAYLFSFWQAWQKLYWFLSGYFGSSCRLIIFAEYPYYKAEHAEEITKVVDAQTAKTSEAARVVG